MEIKKGYVKYAVYAFNLWFCIIGFILLGIGIWVQVGLEHIGSLVDVSKITRVDTLLMLCGGIVILLSSCFGAYAVNKESKAALIWLSLAIAVALVLQFAGGLYALLNRDDVRSKLKSGISHAVSTSYGGNSTKSREVTRALNWIQKNKECCGAQHPLDWKMNSTWYKKASENGSRVLVPASCCTKDGEKTYGRCNEADNILSLLDRNSIYPYGCIGPAVLYMKKYYKIVGTVGCTIGFIQLVGLVLVCLLLNVRRFGDRRRDDDDDDDGRVNFCNNTATVSRDDNVNLQPI